MIVEKYEIIGVVCLFLVTLFSGVIVGLNIGEKVSGIFKKKYKQKRKECKVTYSELERIREELRKRSDEIIAAKAKLFDIKEAAENYQKECDNIAEIAGEYFKRYTIVSIIAIKHGLADVCNKALTENGLPTIEKKVFDEYV